VIPQHAGAKINFRLLPGDTPEYVVETIRAIVDDEHIEIKFDDWKAAPVADYVGSDFKKCISPGRCRFIASQ